MKKLEWHDMKDYDFAFSWLPYRPDMTHFQFRDHSSAQQLKMKLEKCKFYNLFARENCTGTAASRVES